MHCPQATGIRQGKSEAEARITFDCGIEGTSSGCAGLHSLEPTSGILNVTIALQLKPGGKND